MNEYMAEDCIVSCIACLMLGPVSSLAYAQDLEAMLGIRSQYEDGTDQGGGAAEAKEDGTLTPEEVQVILKDYPAATFNDSYQERCWPQTDTEVRLIAEFLTELPETLEFLLEAHEAQQGPGLHLAPGGGLDRLPHPGGGWFVLMNRYASPRYRRYRCTQNLVPTFYGFRHKIYAGIGSSISQPVRTRDHSVNRLE